MHQTTRSILSLLSRGTESSGEAIADLLGISRAAVWKHVSELRSLGYEVKSSPGKGYVLASTPDIPYEVEVHRHLAPQALGSSIIYITECESTNLLLKRRAGEGAREGTVIVTNSQTAGRGRRGRTWLAAPFESLLFSVLLRPPLPPRELFGLTLVAGVAVAQALHKMSYPAKLKWPNDILLGGHKVCGILAESSGELDHTEYVALGIGINVSGYPAGTEYRCTSLSEHGPTPKRAALLAALLTSLQEYYAKFLDGQLPEILNLWRDHSATLGCRVTAHTALGDIYGLAKDINPEGGLILELDDGTETIITAGEVSVRMHEGGHLSERNPAPR